MGQSHSTRRRERRRPHSDDVEEHNLFHTTDFELRETELNVEQQTQQALETDAETGRADRGPLSGWANRSEPSFALESASDERDLVEYVASTGNVTLDGSQTQSATTIAPEGREESSRPVPKKERILISMHFASLQKAREEAKTMAAIFAQFGYTWIAHEFPHQENMGWEYFKDQISKIQVPPDSKNVIIYITGHGNSSATRKLTIGEAGRGGASISVDKLIFMLLPKLQGLGVGIILDCCHANKFNEMYATTTPIDMITVCEQGDRIEWNKFSQAVYKYCKTRNSFTLPNLSYTLRNVYAIGCSCHRITTSQAKSFSINRYPCSSLLTLNVDKSFQLYELLKTLDIPRITVRVTPEQAQIIYNRQCTVVSDVTDPTLSSGLGDSEE